MDENKWEYDYSSSNNPAGDTGYPNVGSSGMNTANTASTFSESTQPSGGATPPPAGPQNTDPAAPKKPKKNAGKAVKSIVALVLAAAMGFMGGFVGARFGGNNKVIIQQVERSSSSLADSESAAEGTTVSSGMTTAQVAKTVSPSVVVITTEQVVYSQWSWYGQSQVESGAGSGVIISSDGYILTCDHVVAGASNITVTIGDDDYTATVVGEDDTSDVAVLKIDATDLTPATVGNSDSLAVGESVLAVGNPLGELGGTVTSGIVSALNRSVSIQSSSSVNTMSLIQMDASVSPGNSGGALINEYGQVVGINSLKISDSSYELMGFSIPISSAKEIIDDLIAYGRVPNRPKLGISYFSNTSNQQYNMIVQIKGLPAGSLIIADINEDSDLANSSAQVGDLITAVNGKELSTSEVLLEAIENAKVGDTLTLTLCRISSNYQTKEFNVKVKLVEDTGNTASSSSQQQQEQTTQQDNRSFYYNPFN